jgi:hypothetical protein
MDLQELYKSDGYAWCNINAELLRERKFDMIDIDNLIEEIEDMGRRNEINLDSYLFGSFTHILKWIYQPEKRCASWEDSIQKNRRPIKKLLDKNPSLKGKLQEIILEAYQDARKQAAHETKISIHSFPLEMPFTYGEAMTDDWLPE